MSILTNAGVPPEYVPVKEVEGEMTETPGDFTVKVFSIEGAVVEGEEEETNFNYTNAPVQFSPKPGGQWKRGNNENNLTNVCKCKRRDTHFSP